MFTLSRKHVERIFAVILENTAGKTLYIFVFVASSIADDRFLMSVLMCLSLYDMHRVNILLLHLILTLAHFRLFSSTSYANLLSISHSGQWECEEQIEAWRASVLSTSLASFKKYIELSFSRSRDNNSIPSVRVNPFRDGTDQLFVFELARGKTQRPCVCVPRFVPAGLARTISLE